MKHMIEITGTDMVKFVKKVYDLSSPLGLGLLHFRDEPLSDEDAEEIVNSPCGVTMDYVHGRACKMRVTEKDGKLYIPDTWFDHSDTDLEQLLEVCTVAV